MERELANMRQALFDKGYLDEEFTQLEEMQDNANPNYAEIIVAWEENPLNFTKLDSYMLQFSSPSLVIGAKKVKTESTKFREYCTTANADGCKKTFKQLKKEHDTLKKKLQVYFQFSRQIGPAEKATRPK